jgi:hypothetical protein
MKATKLRVIKDYAKLSDEIQEQLKLVYTEGFSQHLISFKNMKGETVSALRFETFEKIYLIRMSIQKAEEIIENDDDYDDDGNLRDDVKEKYEDDHSDIDYLSENDNYDDV